ncbi:MAG TPA: hypothetical protein VN851_28175 [Thermoanaerobaculia bacterium]|nr:hypothetical protein [Thermoanaerobaculia bacterium]
MNTSDRDPRGPDRERSVFNRVSSASVSAAFAPTLLLGGAELVIGVPGGTLPGAASPETFRHLAP